MKSLGSLGEFALELAALEGSLVLSLHKGAEKIGQIVEQTAKDKIGEYQDGIGPFPAWEELAEATKEDRLRQGFTENDPLLRTGDLKNSISHISEGLVATIGSNLDIAAYQELGTNKIPPRPFLGPSVDENHEKIRKIAGAATVAGILGAKSIDAALGYDHVV